MRSAALPLQKALHATLTAAFAGESCPWRVNHDPKQALPYGVIGSDTETEWRTKVTDGSSLTHTLRIFSKHMVECKRLAGIAIEAVTAGVLALEDEHYMAERPSLELFDVIVEREPSGDIYGAVLVFRFMVSQINE
jgi:hypothetical protein